MGWVDLGAAQVTIPAALMKSRKDEKASGAPRLVSLAPRAVAILRDPQPLTDTGSKSSPARAALTGPCPT